MIKNKSLVLLLTIFLAIISVNFVSATDSNAPTVKSIDPNHGAVNVVTNKMIKLTFSERIKPGSNYNKIELKSSSGKHLSYSKTISGNILYIKSNNGYELGTKYSIIIHSDTIRDLSGNSNSMYGSAFTTIPIKLIDQGSSTRYSDQHQGYVKISWKAYIKKDGSILDSVHFYIPTNSGWARSYYDTITIKKISSDTLKIIDVSPVIKAYTGYSSQTGYLSSYDSPTQHYWKETRSDIIKGGADMSDYYYFTNP